LLKVQFSGIVHRNDAKPCTALFTEDLPGNDIGVTLEDRDHDLVVGFDMRSAIGLRNEVDRFSGSAREDDLARQRSVDEPANRLAGIFVGAGRFLAQLMQPAMNVGVLLAVEPGQAIDHCLRLVGGGGVIEVDQRAAVDLAPQDWKIATDRGDIERGGARRSGRPFCHSRPGDQHTSGGRIIRFLQPPAR